MKTYKSTLIVRADRVLSVTRDGNNVMFHLEEDGAVLTLPSKDFPVAAAGGYLVSYSDGVMSFVPASSFEARFRPSPDVDHIAQVAHEINRAYCASMGDYSQLPWDDAPKWQRDSAIAGVMAHLESDLTPEQSHESWMSQKAADGWKYGPLKDAAKKEHPCFLPYDQLPPEQRTKDHLFRSVVKALA